jgi:hypothetical protein
MRTITLFLVLVLVFSCGRKEEKAAQKQNTIQQEYLQKGGEIVKLTQSELLKNVSHAMSVGGPGYAVDFCNVRAMVLKDSLSKMYKCEIKRIATKYRNPLDMPQSITEKDQLDKYQLAYQQGDSLVPNVYLFDDRIEYYQAIILDKGACLVCHGIPGKQIASETLEKINMAYPNDLATGFALNDLRGAWKITFMK